MLLGILMSELLRIYNILLSVRKSKMLRIKKLLVMGNLLKTRMLLISKGMLKLISLGIDTSLCKGIGELL